MMNQGDNYISVIKEYIENNGKYNFDNKCILHLHPISWISFITFYDLFTDFPHTINILILKHIIMQVLYKILTTQHSCAISLLFMADILDF